ARARAATSASSASRWESTCEARAADCDRARALRRGRARESDRRLRPALARGRDLRIDIGFRWAQPLLQFNGGDVGTNATRGVSAGLLLPGRIGAVRFAFGAAVWLPDQWLLRQRWMAYGQPRFIYYDNRTQRMLLSTNL